ncbi:MAG: hypothetical protein Q4F29_12320 [Lachnospiraceae bacterium]|nr:hypothetical protein [Lachnospiraceae bacterium]
MGDMLFFLMACLGLAETVDLFMGKDFIIFFGSQVEEKDYDTKKVFAVEKWLFAADTIGCFLLSKGAFLGFAGQMTVIVLLLLTLAAHGWVFNNEKFMTESGLLKKQRKKEARIAWRNRKKDKK